MTSVKICFFFYYFMTYYMLNNDLINGINDKNINQ